MPLSAGGLLVSSYVADMTSCQVLPPHVSAMLVPLRHFIASMDRPDRLPQIEVAVGDQPTGQSPLECVRTIRRQPLLARMDEIQKALPRASGPELEQMRRTRRTRWPWCVCALRPA